MAPVIPKHVTAGKLPVVIFEGAMAADYYTPTMPDERLFHTVVTLYPQHERFKKLGDQKPPLHFHPFQHEYFKVTEGRLVIEMNGREQIVSAGDPEIDIEPWTHHRIYPPPGTIDEKITFLVSADDAVESPKMTLPFFENWYRYQDQVLMLNEPIDFLQVLCIWDAGGTYPTLPEWVPFGRSLGYVLGVVLGRWVGGLLGYRPYMEEWTTEWKEAQAAMEKSKFFRR